MSDDDDWHGDVEPDTLGAMLRRQSTRDDEIQQLHRELVERGELGRWVLHRYMCRRGCRVATVFRYQGLTLCAVADYKLSHGANLTRSVESARSKNTLDGDRHWPGHVYDVEELARFGPEAGMHMVCRHQLTVTLAVDVLAAVEGVTAGHPRPPTRL